MPAEIVLLAKKGSLHHAQPLSAHFGERCVVESDWMPDRVLRHDPDLVITFDEHGAELGLCVAEAARRGVATLQIMDGILEWRRTWNYPTSVEKRPINQPVLSHKVACLGRIDAAIMESWGNVGTCEIVGSPRLDSLVRQRRPPRTAAVHGRPLRLLVMTAKTPGFSPEQIEVTYRSLFDLKDHLSKRGDIEVVWRVTQHLHERLGVRNTVHDVLSTELHDILASVDAVITTPSTAMLESMLFGHPVALLDYHNCPHYVPGAWRIACEQHIAEALSGLRNAPRERMLYQEFVLEQALLCKGPALARMASLIEEMIRIRRESRARGGQLAFPARILQRSDPAIAWPIQAFDLEKLYPHHPVFGNREMTRLQAELECALGTINVLRRQLDVAVGRLRRIPGYRLARWVKDVIKRGRSA